jgi:transcriptional regulator with XRE-family HTH domain
MAKNFELLRAKMSPGARARSEAKTDKMILEIALDELRAARHLTQERLAKVLHINQSAISKLERRTDMYVSTLHDMIKAMGGSLEIRAVFPEGIFRISQFSRFRRTSFLHSAKQPKTVLEQVGKD